MEWNIFKNVCLQKIRRGLLFRLIFSDNVRTDNAAVPAVSQNRAVIKILPFGQVGLTPFPRWDTAKDKERDKGKDMVPEATGIADSSAAFLVFQIVSRHDFI